MEISSLIGPFIAVGMIIGGMIAKGATHLIPEIMPWSHGGIPSILIVVGGTAGALLVAYPMTDYVAALKGFMLYLKKPDANRDEIAAKIIELAQVARKESILALEKQKDSISFAPLRKAVKLAVDGTDPTVLQDTLETEAHFHMEEAEVAVKFWEDIGAIAPTIGILGAVIGLMNVMGKLDQPKEIGPGISVAFIATLYGVGIANIIGIPIGKKLKRNAILHHYAFEMVIIGIDGILSGLNPKIIEEKLKVFTNSHEEE